MYFNTNEQYLFEMLILESFQAGLAWEYIPNKRGAFHRKAYDSFNLNNVCTYDDRKANELLDNKDIILNRLKIKASISNAKAFYDTFIYNSFYCF